MEAGRVGAGSGRRRGKHMPEYGDGGGMKTDTVGKANVLRMHAEDSWAAVAARRRAVFRRSMATHPNPADAHPPVWVGG